MNNQSKYVLVRIYYSWFYRCYVVAVEAPERTTPLYWHLCPDVGSAFDHVREVLGVFWTSGRRPGATSARRQEVVMMINRYNRNYRMS